MAKNFSGLWPAMLTPLDDQGRPNLDGVDALVTLFVKQELDGLYVLGSTGQGPMLALEHRRAVAERVVQAAGGRLAVMIHVGTAATEDAVALAQHAARIGADSISSVAPYYYSYAPEAVFEHYRCIGAATDLPLFVYHLAMVQRMQLGPREYARRLLALPNIAGMKFTDHDLYQLGLLHTYTEGRLTFFSGADELLCHAALSGAAGAIGTFYNLWGPVCRAVRQAFLAGGSLETARRFMLTFQSVIDEVLESGSVWAFLRAAMRIKYGIEIGPPRAPLGMAEKPWSDDKVKERIAEVDSFLTAAQRG